MAVSSGSENRNIVPTKPRTQQQNEVPLNDYAQAIFTHPMLQRTARVMTSPCTYTGWTGAASSFVIGSIPASPPPVHSGLRCRKKANPPIKRAAQKYTVEGSGAAIEAGNSPSKMCEVKEESK